MAINPTEPVLISKAEYESLKEDSEMLACLEAVGVDNWSGYEAAMELFMQGEEDDLDEDTDEYQIDMDEPEVQG